MTVIDDAYNANPDSMRAALKALAAIGRGRPGARTLAVLGEMRELGASAREEHDAVGRLAVRLDIHQLLVVGEAARPIHLGASLRGLLGRRVGLRRRHRRGGRAGCADDLRAGRRRAVQGVQRGPARAAWRRPCSTTGRRRGTEEEQPMRAILLAGGLSLIFTLLGTRLRDPGADHQGLRPADPRRRPDDAPHQARHAHHGRRW